MGYSYTAAYFIVLSEEEYVCLYTGQTQASIT